MEPFPSLPCPYERNCDGAQIPVCHHHLLLLLRLPPISTPFRQAGAPDDDDNLRIRSTTDGHFKSHKVGLTAANNCIIVEWRKRNLNATKMARCYRMVSGLCRSAGRYLRWCSGLFFFLCPINPPASNHSIATNYQTYLFHIIRLCERKN